jgi:DNA-binding CsgD family transcriptional regulator
MSFTVALGESVSPDGASHSGENACLNHVFAGSEEAKVKRTTLPQILSTVANHPLVRISASGERCNLEIGWILYVSPNTVKAHLKSIYRKLGVSSREEAAEQARARGLI